MKKLTKLLILSLAVNVFLLGSSFTSKVAKVQRLSATCGPTELINTLEDMREWLQQDIEENGPCTSKFENYQEAVSYCLELLQGADEPQN